MEGKTPELPGAFNEWEKDLKSHEALKTLTRTPGCLTFRSLSLSLRLIPVPTAFFRGVTAHIQPMGILN